MTAEPETERLSIRQVAVARAYVQGLEADRVRLAETEGRLSHTVWEVVQLGAYNRAMHKALGQTRLALETGKLDSSLLDRVDSLLAEAEKIYAAIWICACGHSKYDHDELGCMYLGCAAICGVS